MPKRQIAVSRNGRDVLFGVHSKDHFDRYWAVQDRDEIVDYRIELKNWLDTGETVASTAETTSGLTATPTINSTSVDYIIQGSGCFETEITTSGGLKKIIRMDVVDPSWDVRHGFYRHGGYYGQ